MTWRPRTAAAEPRQSLEPLAFTATQDRDHPSPDKTLVPTRMESGPTEISNRSSELLTVTLLLYIISSCKNAFGN